MTSEREARPSRSEAEPAAFDARTWVEEHGDALYRYAMSRLGRHDLAEDVVQDTFLAALSARGRFEGRASSRTWLVAILRRKIVDRLRRGEGQGPGAQAGSTGAPGPLFDKSGVWINPPSRWTLPDQAMESDELRAVLDDCLDRLPDQLAEPFLLREVDGLDAEEVRRSLDLTAGNLRVRLHRARLLLRGCLERNWFDA